MQPQPPGPKQSSHLNFLSSWDHRHTPPPLANYLFSLETGSRYVAQAGLELLASSHLPTLAFQSSGTTGFRLFFTSVPGDREKEESPQPRRKRQPSSSSSEDSDEEWRRCREAAVSASDILQESAIHSPGTVEKEAKKKRKLKKKAKKVASVDSAVAATTPTSMATVQKQKSGELNGDQVSLGTKRKKKKKKAKKASEASPFPPAKSATAVPAN
ncbi:protein CUSTOS isoform X7 [Pongo abelii]|uniref:protein CUSTOS isoform X7 n=1 Tax=Pongo abelii TaxID=9601 RepID=UPI00300413FB